MAVERSLILIKPDAVERKLAGEILARLERRGFALRAGKFIHVDRKLGETHYAEHREKPFFGELVEFITSGPTLALVVEGEGAIATLRKTIGATNPADAEPGSIRGDLASSMPDNLVHGSDSPESAAREVALWFSDDELV
jgi:nucleoside-diphosphate kinase